MGFLSDIFEIVKRNQAKKKRPGGFYSDVITIQEKMMIGKNRPTKLLPSFNINNLIKQRGR